MIGCIRAKSAGMAASPITCRITPCCSCSSRWRRPGCPERRISSGASCACGGFTAHVAGRRRQAGRGWFQYGGRPMTSGYLWESLRELILSIGAMLLLLVAAWRGDGATRAIGWASVVLLLVAGLSLLGPAGHGGLAFGG